MKHPVLRIKKDSVIYDENAPQRSHPEIRAAWRRRIVADEEHRRRRRPGRGILIAVIVVAVGLFLVWNLRPRSLPDRATIAGWQVILRATHSADTLIVGVTFIAVDSQWTGAAVARMDISVMGTDVRRTATSTLGRSPMTIREDIPFTQGMSAARAVVSVDGATATLSATIPAS